MDKLHSGRQGLFSLVGAITILTAAIVMAGWVFGIPSLTTVFPGYPSMRFNTAMGFAFSGLATLLLYSSDNKLIKNLYYPIAAGLLLVSMATLLQYIFNINLGIDQLFFHGPDAISISEPYAGRLAGASAFSFCILGLAFIGLRSPVNRFRHWAQYSLHFVALDAIFALLGYVLHLTPAYRLAHFTSMAIHTSLLLIILSVTLSLYNPDMGIPGLFTGKGMGNEMARKVFPLLLAVTLVLGYVRIRLFEYHIASPEFAVAVGLTVFLVVMLAVIWTTAVQLNKLEEAKHKTEEVNYKLHLDIAAAKKLEQQKDEINKRNLLFVQQAPSPIAMFDTNMHYIAASEQWIKDYKLEGKEVIGRSHYEVFPEIGEDWKTIHRDCLKGGINKCDEFYFIRADGTSQWIAWDVRPWYNADNAIGGLLMYTADISALKKNETAIKEAMEMLADAQQIAHTGSWDWNIVTNETKWSDELYRIFGVEPGSISPKKGLFTSRMDPEDAKKLIDNTNEILDGKTPADMEYRVAGMDGAVRDVEIKTRVFRNKEGNPVRMVSTIADITDRKKLERELYISEKEFRSAFTNSASGMTMTGLDGKWIRINDAFCKMVGYSQQELMRSKTFRDITHPDDLDRDIYNLAKLVKKETNRYQVEKRYIHRDGSILWGLVTISVVFDEGEIPLYYIVQITDITQRKKLERELMLSEKDFRNSFENAAIGMAIVSPQGKYLKVNNELCRIVGYTRDELLQMHFKDITYPETVDDNLLNMKRLAAGEIEHYQVEKRYIHKNGSLVWINLTVSMVFDEGHLAQYAVSQMTDITERKEIESQLKKVNSELNSIFNTETHVSIIGTDLNGIITHFSKGAEILLGYKADELVGQFTTVVFHDPAEVEARSIELSAQLHESVQGFDVFVAFARNSDFESREWTYICKDGSQMPVQLVVSPTKDENGNTKGYLCIATDITERKEAEEARRNYAVVQSRNKEMEEFAYIASHDLQEPLRTVSSFIKLLSSEYGGQLHGDAQQYLAFISASTARMSELIKGLLEYSRIGKQKTVEAVDCNLLVKEVIDDLGVAIKESDAVITVKKLPVIKAFPTEMKQLFQNLLSNAIKFRKPFIPPQITITASHVPGYWKFEVSDNGIGIDSVHYHKIFILFQRLHKRDAYSGTGIGLSYCKKIVELHHGHIWVESVPGLGSHFFFTISTHNV